MASDNLHEPNMFIFVLNALIHREYALTIAPNITLMGEFPIMYALQSHPFNWHLQGKKHKSFIVI